MAETRQSDIRVVETELFFDQAQPRGSFAFGAVIAGELTFCHARVRVENRRGQVADGWGAILLSYPWAYPGDGVPAAVKDEIMRRTAAAIARRATDLRDHAHPIDHFRSLEPELTPIGAHVSRELEAAVPLPALGALVCASPLDAALHDAFGRVNGIPTWAGYGSDFCAHDLASYLGPEFRGRYVADYLRTSPAPAVPVAHTVGGLDPLRPEDVGPDAIADELPQSLSGWIARDGVRAFKIKLHGHDLDGDLARTRDVHRVATETLGVAPEQIHLSIDLNEQCDDAAYPLALLQHLQREAPATFAALQYVEQPAPRGLEAAPVDLSPVAALKPVVLDEGLTSLATLDRARTLGWTGIALKTCKCQSLMLLALARAAPAGMLVTVQDLSNPGLALLQAVGLAAHLPDLSPLEANARQFYPSASAPEAKVHPAITTIHDGEIATASLSGPGFGYQIERIERTCFRQHAAAH